MHHRNVTIALVVLAVVASAHCGARVSSAAATRPSTPLQRLRIVNEGPSAVTALVVMFPDASVSFGNVAPGAATAYRDVPRGVYQYAAYRHTLNGVVVTQTVFDWTAEAPMTGNAFTYRISVDASRPGGWSVRLVSVTRDE
jgi:hypothetical protein